LDLRRRRLDAKRRMAFLALLLGLDDERAFLASNLADAAILAPLPRAAREHVGGLERETDELRDGEPRKPAEEAEARGRQRDQHERRAGETERQRQCIAEHRAEETARRERQFHR